MIELIRNVLISLYQQLNAAVLLACIASVALLYVEEHGIKNSFKVWCKRIRNDKEFRRAIYLVFYIGMILFRTLLCRPYYTNALENITGNWYIRDETGKLYTEGIENVILFIPFTMLLLWALKTKLKNNKFTYLITVSFGMSFGLSVFIESLQLFLKLGEFQLSDLFFNSLGGVIGGIVFYICSKVVSKGKHP